MSEEAEVERAPWVFLLGRPPMDEYLSFLTQARPGANVNIPAAAQRWRQAAQVVDALAVSEAGAADNHTMGSLPENLNAIASDYLADPATGATYGLVPAQIGMICLDDLVVFQKQVNLRYVNELRNIIGDWSVSDEELLKFCLDIDQPSADISVYQSTQNTYTFRSVSTDARFLGASLLDASQVSGYVPQGRARYALVMYLGYGANALNVVGINGRLILNNGSHRAYALRAAGLTHVPAVVQTATREDDLAIVPTVQQNAPFFLQNPRPPMLKDYFNDSLHEVVTAPLSSRQIRLQFGVEPTDVPR